MSEKRRTAKTNENGNTKRFKTILSFSPNKSSNREHAEPSGILEAAGVIGNNDDNEAEDDHIDQSHIISTLEKAYEQVRHFPASPTYPVICKLLALQYINIQPDKTAFYLMESAAVTFRHQTLVDIGKKIRKLKKDTESMHNELCIYDDVRKSLIFNKEENIVTSLMNQLPTEWTVCQISVVENAGKTSHMLLTRLSRNMQPITVQVYGFNCEQGRTLLDEFTSILEASGKTLKTDNKYEFWKQRQFIDDRMRNFQDNMQTIWLGVWKYLLLGQLQYTSDYENIEKDIKTDLKNHHLSLKDEQIILMIISISDGLSCVEITELLSTLIETTDKTVLKTLLTYIQLVGKKITQLSLRRHPVILVLDKAIQHLPWESIGVLREHCVTRVPSLYSLSTQLTYLQNNTDNTFDNGVNINKTYYIVNPDNNLPSTQEFFESSYVNKTGWKGVIGERPSTSHYIEGLTQNDLFIYCGHGDGVQYCHGDELQKLNCRATVLLMGCSSGLLKSKGSLDPFGTILNYFLAGCPCVVGNLWNVTDREIDRFCKCLLDTWLESESGTSILEVLPIARQACRLLYLTGSAPIVYGLPVFIRK